MSSRLSILAAAMAVLLTGCAAAVVSSTPRSVTVRAGSMMVGDATRLADAECQKHGRFARAAGKNTPNEFVFDCVQ